MHRWGRHFNGAKSCSLLFGVVVIVNLQCALSGSIIDRGHFETKLTDMRLGADGVLKVYHGGCRRDIPLQLIATVDINPAITIAVENELYFSAEITLKDGTSIHSLDKDQTMATRAFVSVQNSLVGSKDNERFVIGLHDVTRITVY